MPLAQRSFSQLIDFTRTTAGTYVDSTGKIVNTPASRNLLTFTQQFDNAAWTKTNATVVPNQNPAAASLGGELVTNGDFASATGWTANTGWVIGSGVATATTTSSSLFGGGFTPVAGKLYALTFDCTITSGILAVAIGVGPQATFTTGGTKTVYLTSGTSTSRGVEFYGGAVSGTVDNVSVREVVGGWNVAPDGTSTADTLIGDGVNANHAVQQSQVASATGKTFSIYGKAGTNSFLQIYFATDFAPFANFDLTNGTVGSTGTATTASIISVGNGWYRCIVSTTSTTATTPVVQIVPASTSARGATSTLTTSVLIWGAQAETGTTATDYTRNVGGLFPPRFDYDPVTLAPRGLLIEEQRVNLLTYSEQFDNANWVKSGLGVGTAPVVTANAAVAPDGSTTADQVALVNSGTTTGDWSWLYQNFIPAANTTYVFSVWLKAATPGDVGKTVVISGLSTTTTTLTADWQRVSVSGTTASTATISLGPRIRGNEVPTTSVTFLIWGAQLEAGAFATSYIPTVASQVTRAADVAAITGPNFTPWYNQSAGTFVVEGSVYSTGLSGNRKTLTAATEGNFNNSARTAVEGSSSGGGAVTVGGVSQAAFTASGVSANTPFKLALAMQTNDFAFSLNGATALTDASGTMVSTPIFLNIGNGPQNSSGSTNTAGDFLNGHIRSIRYYPSRLSNAQIQALTA